MIIPLLILMLVVVCVTVYISTKPYNSLETTSDGGKAPQPISQDLYEVPSQLKFKSSWFSDEYVTPYFYHYGWQPLLQLRKPMLKKYDYEIKDLSYRLGSGNFDGEKKRWATVGACLEHNQRIKFNYKESQKELEQSRIDDQKYKAEAFKRANS